jgi:uncharacterized membrane protein
MSSDPQIRRGGTMEHKRRRPALVTGLLVLIVMLGMGLRLHELDVDSLWLDEINTTREAQEDLTSVLTRHRHSSYTHPPLVDFVTRFFITVAGDSDFVVRTQAMLFGSLTILIAYKVGETLWNRGVGLTGSALLAVNAYHVHYSQEARSYALMAFLALLSLFFLWKALHRNMKRFWLGFIVCTSLSLYNHYFAALFLPVAVVLAACVIGQNWISLRRRADRDSEAHASSKPSLPVRQGLLFLLSLATVGLSYVPWLPALRTHVAFFMGLQGGAGSAAESLQSSVGSFHGILEQYSGVSGAVLVLWAGMLVIGFAACDLKRMALVASWVGTPFLFVAVVQSGFPNKPRYVLFILPLLLLVVARGITSGTRAVASRLPAARGHREWLVAGMVTLTVLIFASLSVPALREYYFSEKEDWRGATAYLLHNMESTDVIIADGRRRGVGDAKRVERGLSYYSPRLGTANLPILHASRGLWDDLGDTAGSQGRVWGVVWYPGQLRAGHSVIVEQFHLLAVLRLRDPSGDTLQDAKALLQVLIDVLPPEADFDLHLALAALHQHTGRCEQASLALHRASRLKPGGIRALEDLREAIAEWEGLCSGEGDLKRALWRNLGDRIAFLGYDVDPQTAQAGGTLRITVGWQALARTDKNYTAFIHLTDEEGRLWAQDDRLIEDNGRPTSTWRPAAVARQEFEVQLSPDLPSGEYNLSVGVYHWETGERLPILDVLEDGAVGDTILLQRIPVSD